jgi:YidC/Oxa1 family membrane protein insertase
MDSGRFLLAVILMIAVMVVTNILLPPPRQPAPVQPDSAGAVTAQPGPTQQDSAAATTPAPAVADSGVPAVATPAQPADTLVVRSPLYEYLVSTRGAELAGARLLEFNSLLETRADQPVELAPGGTLGGVFSYRLRIGTREIDFADLSFVPSSPGLQLAEGQQPAVLRMVHTGADGLRIEVAYGFDPDRYTIDTRIAVSGVAGTPNLFIALPGTLAHNEAVPTDDERALAYVVNSEQEGISSVRLDNVKAERVENGPLLWAAVKNKYFVAAALGHPETGSRFGGLIATPLPDDHAARMVATLLPGPDGTFALRYYVGPQEPQRLAEMGNAFQDVNPFGWRAFRPILRPLGHGIQAALYWMHGFLGIGYGWVLVLFGVLIRIALWPLNAKAMRSQMKNMEIQPKLKEIQTKYKNHPEQLQKEMLRLYKEEGFNPMGGCLPMLIPLPILITLFFVFQSTIAFRGVEFLWLPDLSQKDPLYILPVLLGVSMFLMQWLSTRSMTEINPQMKFMLYAMPIFMTVIFLNFASGLNLYYTAMNFASLPQQLQLTRERKRYQAERGIVPAKA